MGPQFQSQTPILVWVSPSWYRCQRDTLLLGSNPSSSMGAGVGLLHPSPGPHHSAGPHPGMGACRRSPSQYWALIPVQVPTWGPPFWYRTTHSRTGSPSQYRCWNGTSHPSTGHPILVVGPHPGTGCPNPVQVLGWDSASQYGCWYRSLMPVPGPHPRTDINMGLPSRYGTPHAGSGSPSRYGTSHPSTGCSMPVPGPHSGMGAVMGSPSQYGC